MVIGLWGYQPLVFSSCLRSDKARLGWSRSGKLQPRQVWSIATISHWLLWHRATCLWDSFWFTNVSANLPNKIWPAHCFIQNGAADSIGRATRWRVLHSSRLGPLWHGAGPSTQFWADAVDVYGLNGGVWSSAWQLRIAAVNICEYNIINELRTIVYIYTSICVYLCTSVYIVSLSSVTCVVITQLPAATG